MKKNTQKILLSIILLQLMTSPVGFAQTYSLENSKTQSHQAEKNLVFEKNQDDSGSVIEKMYNLNTDLTQYGYEVFTSDSTMPVTSRVSQDYKLRIGDRINVYFWGDTVDILAIAGSSVIKPSIDATVDNEGNIFIPGVGLIQAKGQASASVEQQIYSLLSSKFSDFKVKVTVYDPGNFPVMVMGNVKHPGVVYLNSSSTFIDALNMAGGVLKIGSLRDIVYINSANRSKSSIDLYDLLVKGDYKTLPLKEGDVILVKPIGKTLALTGGVKNPAIYEFKNGENIKDIVNIAGGFLPSINQSKMQIESYDASISQKTVKDIGFIELNKILPKDGDILGFKTTYQYAENFVALRGNVKNPGKVQYKKGMRLSDVLKSDNELLLNTNVSQAIIERISGTGKDIITVPVSLSRFFAGDDDPLLQPQDSIRILTDTKMGHVEITGEVANPGYIPYKPGMTLKEIFSLINLEQNPNNLVAEIASEDGNKFIYLYDLLTRNQKDMDLHSGDRIRLRLITDREALRTIKVMGYVNNPGTFKVKPGMRLSDVINIAGGLTEEAYLKGLIFLRHSVGNQQADAIQDLSLTLKENMANEAIQNSVINELDKDMTANKENLQQIAASEKELIEITRKKANKDYGRIIINIKKGTLDELALANNIEVKDGDEIIIPSAPNHVVIVGQVNNQSAMIYYPKKSVKYYIDNVGGLTKHANKSEIYLIRANGISHKVGSFLSSTVEPGDSIIVPSKSERRTNWMGVLKDIAGIGYNALGTIFVLTKI